MTPPLLEVEDLTVQYRTERGPLTAVSNVSFEVHEGEYFGIVGESGCGKSTLAKAVSAALSDNGRIVSGTIRYKGRDITDLSEAELNEEIRWKEIAIIPQSAMNNLDPLETVETQALTLARTHTDLSKAAALERFEEMLDIVGISPNRMDAYPHQLSGGMEQRIIIALALFLDPSLIIADEPTTALDVIMQDQVLKYIDEVKQRSSTGMIMITHDISVVFETCDTLSVMHAGQMVERGSVEALFEDPRHPYAVMLQEAFPDIRDPTKKLLAIGGQPPQEYGEIDYCTFVDRCPLATEECSRAAPERETIPVAGDGTGADHYVACYHHELAQGIEPAHPRAGTADQARLEEPDTPGETLLEVEDLRKYFRQNTSVLDALARRKRGRIQAVDGVSFDIDNNEIVGIIGESGCGKSTLLWTLMGLYKKTDGNIRYRGESTDSFGRRGWKGYRSDVQMVFQDPFTSLDPKMTVRESLMEPLKIHGWDQHDQRVRAVLEDVELEPVDRYIDRLPNQLSGGEKQRVCIARALILEPDLLLADEPLSMLDVSTQAAILNLLSHLFEEREFSMIYVSHDISTVSYVCDSIHVMYLGRIIETGSVEQILNEPQHPYTQALIRAIPIPDPSANRERSDLQYRPQTPVNLGEGCRFRDRCPERMDVCERTPLSIESDDGHCVACHLYYDHEEGGERPAESVASSVSEVDR